MGGEYDGQASDSGRQHVTHRPSTSTAWERAAFAAIVLLLSFAAPVAAGPLEDTTTASGRRDYAIALRLWRPLADQGDAIAQFNLGLTYDKGWGVPQNDAEAVKWYSLAADQGDADAQINLGGMYHNGRGVPQNDAEAVKWFRLAADQGDARAQFNLGFSYDNGRGVPQNHAEALKWFRLAADQRNANAQNDLAVMYTKGEGVPQDFVRAHMWFNLSAARGEQRAAKNRDSIAKRMTAAQIVEAQKLAREWQPKRP